MRDPRERAQTSPRSPASLRAGPLAPWLPLLLLLASLSACGGAQGGEPSSGGPEPSAGAEASAGSGSGASSGASSVAFGVEAEAGLRVGGQPSPAELEAAAVAGARLVISLRAPNEPGAEGERARVESLGMRFVSIPIAGAEDLTVENARTLNEALGDPSERPAILHCGSGNRAGALLAVRARVFGGLEPEEALELGRRAGLTRLEGAVQALLPTLEPEAGAGGEQGGDPGEAP